MGIAGGFSNLPGSAPKRKNSRKIPDKNNSGGIKNANSVIRPVAIKEGAAHQVIPGGHPEDVSVFEVPSDGFGTEECFAGSDETFPLPRSSLLSTG
jgi:hypothetical protein